MKLFKWFLFLVLSFNCVAAQIESKHPKNEFRAVWIATVVNIDWPISNVDSIEKQKTDFINILETYKKLNFNTVIVQIRTAGDAFYDSKFAPWSRFLTGSEGTSPKSEVDILAWLISESHARGFDFHAWLNPYRATFDLKTETLSPNHDFLKHPNWMIKYGEKFYYNPGLPEVQSHLVEIVKEVVQNYDIDGIHFDDYFYPYTIENEIFDDAEAFKIYGNGLSLEDWRRSNVNNCVKSIAKVIKETKDWVQFGISPFGVWRNKSMDPKGSESQTDQTNYDNLYADPMAWIANNSIDYIAPQLYWSVNNPRAPYLKLLQWWSENSKNVNVYIGNATYKIRRDKDESWNNPNEIPNQIDLTRNFPNVQGNVFFSAKGFVDKNQDVTDILVQNQYKFPAIPSVVPNLKREFLVVPIVSKKVKNKKETTFFIDFPKNTKVRYVLVYAANSRSEIDTNSPEQLIDKIFVSNQHESIQFQIDNSKLKKYKVCALSFIDFYGNESKSSIINLSRKQAIIKKRPRK